MCMRAYEVTMPKEKKPEAAGTGTVRLNLTVSQELEKQFRDAVFKKYGLHKGDIQRAIEEAIRLWIARGV